MAARPARAFAPVPAGGVPRAAYAGVFLVALCTLTHEVLPTRIFSVTMCYHVAFVAVSVTMFGMTVGALLVYLFPERFPSDLTGVRLGQYSVAYCVSVVVSFLTQLSIPPVEEIADRLRFRVVVLPGRQSDPLLEGLTSPDWRDVTASYPLLIDAPTDHNPFFFQSLRARELLRRDLWNQGKTAFNLHVIVVLLLLLAIVVVPTVACIVLPLLLRARARLSRREAPPMVFFGAIGLGFMFVEVSSMQRLNVLLGHPAYGLTVVLFSLLLASGAGSYLYGRLAGRGGPSVALHVLALLAVLAAFGVTLPFAIHAAEAGTNAERIAVAVGLLAPLGLAMGMAFPVGMRAASRVAPESTPWLWGVDGAASVLASVLAVVLSIAPGISAAFWTGWLCYAVAAASLLWMARRTHAVRWG